MSRWVRASVPSCRSEIVAGDNRAARSVRMLRKRAGRSAHPATKFPERARGESNATDRDSARSSRGVFSRD
jgi:hypothetical protein